MIRRITCNCIIFLLFSTLVQSQSLDTWLRRLPTRLETFTPQTSRDSSLMAQDNSLLHLIDYLNSGLSYPNYTTSLLCLKLNLPPTLRYIQAYQELSISPPRLEYIQPKNNRFEGFEELNKQFNTYALALQIDSYILQKVQQRNIAQTLYTQQELEQSYRQTPLNKQQATQLISLGSRLNPSGNQAYRTPLSVATIKRKYWLPSLETSLQFSQNYISDNWHKGGNSNLNLAMRTYLSLSYSRGKRQWLGELESKLGVYTADVEGQSEHYRISEDRLRIHSNYGIKISKRWSYTLDGELRTQLFTIYGKSRKGRVIQSAPFAPIRSNLGIGLQYSYNHKSKARYGSAFKLSFNLAPLSHNWRWSKRNDIDLARHGLSPQKRSIHSFGSTLRGQLKWDFNMDLSWTSRIYFDTSYKNCEAEWENTLTMRVGRYFSTRINLHLRFDDSAKPSNGWNKFLQINELLSFGFNYKL